MSNSKKKQLIFSDAELAAYFYLRRPFIDFLAILHPIDERYHRLRFAFKQEEADAIARIVAVDKISQDYKKTLLLKNYDYVAKLARYRFLLIEKEGGTI